MLLSRVADSLYWGARYLERAEDTARIIRAYHELVVDFPGDVVLRVINLSPLDWLQPGNRKTTMEVLFDQYARYRRKYGEQADV